MAQKQSGEMYQLKYILMQLSDLLNEDLEITRFHQECSHVYPRMRYALQIIQILTSGNLTPVNDRDIETLANELMKLKYIPMVMSKNEFMFKFVEDVQIAYDLYVWLLMHREKIAKGVCLIDSVNPVHILDLFITDLENIFWMVYKSFTNTEKDAAAMPELQNNLNAMYEELANLKEMIIMQEDIFRNMSGNVVSTVDVKLFPEDERQGFKCQNRVPNSAHTEQTMSDNSILTNFKTLNDKLLVSSLRHTLSKCKILLNNSSKLEKDEVIKTSLRLFEVSYETLQHGIENEILLKGNKFLGMETHQKVALHSAIDNILEPLLKQITDVTSKKELFLEKISNIWNKQAGIIDQLKLKQYKIYDAVGEEIINRRNYMVDTNLVNPIADVCPELHNAVEAEVFLGEKMRGATNGMTKMKIVNPFIDALLSTNPSVKKVFEHPIKVSQDQSKSITANSIEESKRLIKGLIPEIEASKAMIADILNSLFLVKKEHCNTVHQNKLTKEQSMTPGETIATYILDKMKEEQQLIENQLEMLLRNRNDAIQELENVKQIYHRFVALMNTKEASQEMFDLLVEKIKSLEKRQIDSQQLIDKLCGKGGGLKKN